MSDTRLAPNPSRRGCRSAFTALLCACTMGLSGCESITAGSMNSAQVRFVNTSSGTPDMDVYGNEAALAYNLSFGTVTSYVPLAAGEYRISATRASTTQALVSAKTLLASRRQYTAVLAGPIGDLQETLYPDAEVAAPPGMIAVRVLQESSAGPVDVYLVPGAASLATVLPTVRDVAFGGSTAFENLPADRTYSVVVVPAGAAPTSAGAMLSGVVVGGGSGAVRTVVVADAAAGRSKGLRGFVLSDLEATSN